MMKNRLLILLITLPLLPLFAEDDSFTFSSEQLSVVLAEGKERTLLTGNARVTSNDLIITADEIELFGTDRRFVSCSGNIKVVDEQKGIILLCETLFYDRNEEISRVEGYVEMVDQKNELVAKGGFLENFSKDDITIIQIGVRIVQNTDNEALACRSEFARYDRSNEMLELSGMPVVHKEGDVFKALRITINLDTDEISLDGDVSGNIASVEKKKGDETDNNVTEKPREETLDE